MWIKICGIITGEAALACAENGADAVGFVFTGSKRKISVKAAGAISALLPRDLTRVGVFVDAPLSAVEEIQKGVGLDLLQFHGSESPGYCSRFRGRGIKSFRVASARDLKKVEEYRGKVWASLLDTHQPGQAGGTGRTWDWTLLEKAEVDLSGVKVIAAGGLTAQNVVEALQCIRPYGVDTSSGVESEGKKDPLLITDFIERIRRWEQDGLT